MATIIVTLLIVSWIVGPTRGVVGGLIGGFVGAAVAAGLARMAASGELAVYYTPATLARGALTLGILAAVLALVVPVREERVTPTSVTSFVPTSCCQRPSNCWSTGSICSLP